MNSFSIKLAIAMLFLAHISSLAYAEEKAAVIAAEAGKQLFLRNCSSCHGQNGAGGGPAAIALKKEPPDLTKIAWRRGGKFDPSEISSYIDGRISISAHGSREMPIWGHAFAEKIGGGSLGDEYARGNIAVLVEYLKSIQRY